MAGILEQFPDLTAVLNGRSSLVDSLRGVSGAVPLDPSSLTGNLTAGITALGSAIPSNPQDFVAPLQAALTSLAGAFPKEQFPALGTITNGMSQALAVVAPARDILASGGGLRDLQEIVFENAGDPNAFLGGVIAEITKAIPADSVEILKTFISTLRDFEANIPSDPGAIAEFLARSFLGMPLSLLAEPVGVVRGLHSQIDALVDTTSLDALKAAVAGAASQLAASQALLRSLNPAEAAGYQAAAGALKGVQTELAGIQSRLTGLASGFQSGLAAIDVKGFSGGLKTKLEAFPEIRVAQIDDFIRLVREPLQQLNRSLQQTTPEQLAQAFQGANAQFASIIGEEGFGDIREALLKPFQEVGAAIQGLGLDEVRAAITNALSKIRDAVNQVAAAIESFKNEVRRVVNEIGSVLNSVNLAGTEVGNAVRSLATQIQSSLNALSLEDFARLIEEVIARLSSVLTAFKSTIGPAIQDLNRFREELEAIDLRQSAEPAFDTIKTVTGILENLNLSLVPGGAAAALRSKLDALADIDLSPIRETLTQKLNAALPHDAFHDLAGKYEALSARMADYDPAELLDALQPPFEQLRNALHQFDPAAVLEPVFPPLEATKATLENVSPARLLAPLAQSFDGVVHAMDELAPSRLLSPVTEAFQELMALFEKLNIVPVLDNLEQLFGQWMEKGLSELQHAAKGFAGEGGLKSYLDGIDGSPESPEFGFMIGDVIRPVEDLFNKIMSLVNQIPDDKLLAAFKALQSQFVDGLQTIDPARFAGDVRGRLRERVSAFDPLNNFDVLGSLHTPYSDVVLEFDRIDPIRIPSQLRPKYDELASLVAAVNPTRLFAPLRDQFHGLNGSVISFVGAFDTAGLSPVFGPIKRKLDGLIPVYLHGELNLDRIRAQLQQLNPGRLADELNKDVETLLVGLTKFGDTLVAELPKLAETFTSGTVSFLPQLVKEAFNDVYLPLKGQLDAINPGSIIAELESSVFNPAKAAVESVNPATIFTELGLDVAFDQFRATLSSLIDNLRSIQRVSSSLWKELLDSLDQFNPSQLKAQAEAAFVPAQQFIKDLDLGRTLAAFDQTLARIAQDLDALLQDAEAALEDMARAIPA